MNHGVTWTGLGLLLAAILIPIITFSVGVDTGGWEAIVFGIFFAFIISPMLGIAGLIMLIVGIATGGGQKQQQQVVVHVSGNQASSGSGLRCGACGQFMNVNQSFCTSCGTRTIRG